MATAAKRVQRRGDTGVHDPVELTPRYRARRHREHLRDSLTLAMKTAHPRSLAMLIDTAIESRAKAVEAEREAERPDRR